MLAVGAPEALLDALTRAPGQSVFARVERADDFEALRELARIPEIRGITTERAAVELLWEVCQIPDFRKGLFGQHLGVLKQIYLQLATGSGQLQPDWLAKQIAPLEDATGDLHTLMDRLAAIRIWTYVSQRNGWLRDADAWQERTRRSEDALGDALHLRLVERFVERTARRTPLVVLSDADEWTGGARRRIEVRMSALARDLVSEAMGGFPAELLTAPTNSAPLRGLAYQLAEGFGIVHRSEAIEQWELLDVASRERLRGFGVQEGRRFFTVREALSTRALELRSMLTAVSDDASPPPGIPPQPVLSDASIDARTAERFGYERLGQVVMRIDLVERLALAVRDPRAREEVQLLLRELGLGGAARTRVIQALGGESDPPVGQRRGRPRKRKRAAGSTNPG